MTIQVITENTTVQNATPDEQFTGVTDTRLRESEATTNFATHVNFDPAKYSPGAWTHCVQRFDLSNIPSGATINSATLYLYLSGTSTGVNHTFAFYNCLRNWVENQATWNLYSTGNSWATAGGTGTGDRAASPFLSGQVVNNVYEYKSFDVTSWIADIVSGTIANNYGYHIERTDSSNDSTYRIFQSSNGTNGQRPELVINYTASSSKGAARSYYSQL